MRADGVEFGSSMSKGMARALAGLPIGNNADEAISYRDLLASLKGAVVQLQARSGSYSGRIIDVLDAQNEPPDSSEAEAAERAKKENKPAPKPRPDLMVLLLTDRGEIRRFRASEIFFLLQQELSENDVKSDVLRILRQLRAGGRDRLIRIFLHQIHVQCSTQGFGQIRIEIECVLIGFLRFG